MTSNAPSRTSCANSLEFTPIWRNRAFAETLCCLPVDRSSTTVPPNPSARKRSATCEPMNPAPPVTRTLGNVGRISLLQIGARLLLQREQVPCRVDNTKATPIGGGRFESHTRFVQELVHQ